MENVRQEVFDAARRNDVGALYRIITKNPEAFAERDGMGFSPLLTAFRHGSYKAVEFIVYINGLLQHHGALPKRAVVRQFFRERSQSRSTAPQPTVTAARLPQVHETTIDKSMGVSGFAMLEELEPQSNDDIEGGEGARSEWLQLNTGYHHEFSDDLVAMFPQCERVVIDMMLEASNGDPSCAAESLLEMMGTPAQPDKDAEREAIVSDSPEEWPSLAKAQTRAPGACGEDRLAEWSMIVPCEELPKSETTKESLQEEETEEEEEEEEEEDWDLVEDDDTNNVMAMDEAEFFSGSETDEEEAQGEEADDEKVGFGLEWSFFGDASVPNAHTPAAPQELSSYASIAASVAQQAAPTTTTTTTTTTEKQSKRPRKAKEQALHNETTATAPAEWERSEFGYDTSKLRTRAQIIPRRRDQKRR